MKTRSKKIIAASPEIPLSSDSEPEEILNNVGREEASKTLHNIADVIKSQKHSIKRKRKEIHERNAVQKQTKLSRLKDLEKRKLPDDFLETVSSVLQKRSPILSSEGIRKADSHDEEDDDIGTSITLCSENEAKKRVSHLSEDYISLHGATQFRVAVLPKEIMKPVSLTSSAAEFKQKMLNRKTLQRESVKEMMAKKEKQALTGSFLKSQASRSPIF